MNPDEERALGFGVEGDDEGPDLRDFDESRTLAYTVGRVVLAIIPFGGAADVVIDTARQRVAARVQRTVDEIRDSAGEEALLRRLASDPELEAVFIQGIEAAARTGYEAKRRALARVITAAVLDDARVDESALFVAALRDLDAPHLRALERMLRAEDSVERQEGVTRLNDADVTAAVRTVAEGEHDAVNTALIRAGVAFSVGSLYGGLEVAGMVSDFGRRLLAYVRAAQEAP